MKLGVRVNMFLLVILFVTSVHGNEEADWVPRQFCCSCNTPEDYVYREALVGYDTNLTSLMDPGEGCRWIFKSGTTECCYSDDPDQCEYQTHDKKNCRKNQTYIVHPTYPTRECVLELFKIGHKDDGEYTQYTRSFNFTIKLTVSKGTDWLKYSLIIIATVLFVILASGLAGWYLRMLFNKSKSKKEARKRDEEEKQNKEGTALLGVLRNENEEGFRDLSKRSDMLAARDKDKNSLLHLYGMPYWTEKMTEMIYDYCMQKNLVKQQIDDGEQMLLQSSDKIEQIKNISYLRTNINLLNNLEETPLHVAAKYGRIKAVENLLSIEGVNINAVDQACFTALHHAALKGHTQVIKLLLDKADVNIDAKANDGKTPLLCACTGGKHEAFQVLFQHGAQLNATTDVGENILHIVSEKETEGKLKILKLVLTQNEGEDFPEKQELFTAIVFDDNQETVRSMASESASFRGTPLEIAVSSGSIKAAKLLIEYGANFRKRSDQDKDLHLLLHAVMKGQKGFADFLLRKDPSLVNAKTDNNESYLHVAIEKLNLNAVILFLNMKIDKDVTNSEGQTALEFAEAKLKTSLNENKLLKIISELNKERNDIDKKDIMENIKISSDNMKQIEQKLKEIEIEKQKESEVLIEQLKKATRDEKGWKKALKDLEGEEDQIRSEEDQDDKKRENPTMEKIQGRVTDMIMSNTKLTVGQMAQVLKLLNDEGISRANTGISRANTGISQANTGNRFLMPNSNVNRVSFQSD